MNIKNIKSFSNNSIKYISSLRDKKYSKQHNLFIVEGFEFILKGLKNNWQIAYLLYASAAEENLQLPQIITQALNQDAEIIRTNIAILKKITVKENTQPIIAVFKTKINKLDSLMLQKNNCYLALDRIRDAANLGVIIRSCAAFSISTLFLIGESVYPFNVEVVRASVGSIFDVNLYTATQNNFINFIKQKNAYIVGTNLNSTSDFREATYKKNTNIIIMGNEKEGLSIDLCNICDILVKIPQNNNLNSLNLSTATTLMLFEAQKDKLAIQ